MTDHGTQRADARARSRNPFLSAVRRLRVFRLRSLLVVFVIVALVCALVERRWRPARMQQDGVAVLESRGFFIWYDYQRRFLERDKRRANDLLLEYEPNSAKALIDRRTLGSWDRTVGRDWGHAVESIIGPSPDYEIPARESRRSVDPTLAEALRKASVKGNVRRLSLTSLELSGNDVEPILIECRPTHVSFDNCHLDQSAVETLGQAESIEYLLLPGCTWECELTEAILGNRRIVDLDLRHTGIGDRHLKELHQLDWLQLLNLSFTEVTDEGIAELSAIPRLTSLNLEGCAIHDESVRHLLSMEALQWISLSNTEITTEGVRRLLESEKKFTVMIQGVELSPEVEARAQDDGRFFGMPFKVRDWPMEGQ